MANCPYNTTDLPSIRAGVAQRVITPDLGCCLAGYFHERIATRVRDDLLCHVAVLEGDDGECIALISCDVICFNLPMADEIKMCIEKTTGIPPSHVMLCATHTHTGPVMNNICPLPSDEAWLAALPQVIADTVADAQASCFDAILCAGSREEWELGSNRLGRLKDGSERFAKTDVIGPAGGIDPEASVLMIRDMDGNVRGAVVNYAMHPDVIGGGSADFISADWPGECCRTLAQVYGENVVTVFLNGTCGDINHHVWHETRLPRSGPAKAVQMGHIMAGVAMAAAESAEPVPDAVCGGAVELLEIPFFTRDADFLAEIEALREKAEPAGWEKVLVSANDRWFHDGEIASVPVQVLRFGPLIFVGLPGEVFVDWGLEIKHWSPGEFTFVAELANGWFGYIPTTDQAHRGAYGAKPILSRQLIADAGRQITDTVQVMMWKLWES